MKKNQKMNLSRRHLPIGLKHANPVNELVDTFPLGLHQYQLEPDGALIFRGGNPAADRILGIDHQSLIGKQIEVAFPSLAHTDIPDAYRQVAKNGNGFERELVTYQDEQMAGIFKVQAFQTGPDCMAVLFQDISDKKHTERSLAESEERYRSLVELSPEAIIVHCDGKLVYVNPAGARQMGVERPEQVLGLPITDLLPPETRQLNLEIMEQVAQGKSVPPLEQTIIRPDGSEIEVEIVGAPVLLQGQPAFQLIVRDISERKRGEKELRASDDRYRRLFENAVLGIFQSSLEGKALAVNPAFARMFGYNSPEEVLSTVKNIAVDIFADPNRRAEIARLTQENPEQHTFENIYRRRDGSTFPGTLHLHPVKDAAGRLLYFEGLIEDISKRKAAEYALQESEKHLRSLIEASPLGMHQYALFPDGRLIFTGANPAADHILGIDHQGLINLPIEDAFPTHRQTEIPALYQQVALEGTPYSCEQIAYQDDKTQRAFEIHAFQTGTSRMAVFFQDITEKKRAAESLRESEEKFRALIEKNSEGVVLYDEQGLTIEWNAAQEHISGIPRQEALGRSAWDLQFQLLPTEQKTPTRHAEMKERGMRILQTGQSPIFSHPAEVSIIRPDGTQAFIQQTAFPIKTGSGLRVGSVMRDITERKQAEVDLRRRMIELEALHAVALAGTEAMSTDDLLVQVAGIIREKLYPDHFGVAFLDAVARTLLYHPSFAQDSCLVTSQFSMDEGISGSVARTGISRRVEDVRLDPDYLKVNPDTRSELCVPILIGRQAIGVINLESAKLSSFTEADERLVNALAGELGIALEKLRHLEAEQNRRKELEALEQISEVLRNEGEKDKVIQAVLDRVMVVMHLQGTGIVLYDPQTGDQVMEEGRGEWILAKNIYLPQGQGTISKQVAVSQHYYLNNEVSSDLRLQWPDPGLRIKALLCLALIVDDQTCGLLYLGRNVAFLPQDIHLAITMADTLASALHQIDLHNETQRQLERLKALRAIDQSILSRLNLEQTLEVLLDKITGLLRVDAAYILLYNAQMKMLYPSARHGLPSPLWEETLPLSVPHAGHVAQTCETEIIPDLGLIEDGLTEKIHKIGENFASYAAVPLIAKGELKGVLQIFTHSRLEPSADWMGFLETLADQTAIAINSAQLFNEQQQTNARLTKAYEDTIDGWSRALDLRDRETEGHSQRVTDLTLKLARRMDIPEDQMIHIRRGAKLHDIGKMGIPDNILLKPDRLTQDEWKIMRQHPTFAADLLSPIEFLAPALEIPFCHHEKWDGTGYPQGLSGKEIPLAARIFAVIDVWDAVTHDRPYRPAWTLPDTLAYIREQAGKHFDPRVVEEFLVMSLVDKPE
jgi:PAS domain S-box-containing protein